MNQAGASVSRVTNKAGRDLFFSEGFYAHSAVTFILIVFYELRKMLKTAENDRVTKYLEEQKCFCCLLIDFLLEAKVSHFSQELLQF